MDRGRQERRGQAHEAFAGASGGLQGPPGPSPTQALHIQATVHVLSTCTFPGMGCSLPSWANTLAFEKIFCTPC